MTSRVLIVEDNVDLAYGLQTVLEIEGYEVTIAKDGPTGLSTVDDFRPHLIILDLMLPGLNGYQVLKEIRRGDPSTPVLVLTARGEEADKVLGFNIGADDYVTKPFGTLELLARVRALLRRQGHLAHDVRGESEQMSVERFGAVEVNPASRTVYRHGDAVQLAPKEFDLLVALLRRRGAAVSRVELLRELWGYDSEVVTRTVDMHIAELRRKLESDPSKPQHILTVRKVGYRLDRG